MFHLSCGEQGTDPEGLARIARQRRWAQRRGRRRQSVLRSVLAGRAGRLGLVAPPATEELAAAVLGDHRCYSHHAHDEENRKEDNCNYEDWHTAPLVLLCVAYEHHFRDGGHRWV